MFVLCFGVDKTENPCYNYHTERGGNDGKA